jgi:hypothetical protein
MAKQDPNETAILIMSELREVIADGHGLLRDLERQRRIIQDLIDEIPQRVDREVGEQIGRAAQTIQGSVQDAIAEATKAVRERIDRLAATFLGADRRARAAGLPSLEEVAQHVGRWEPGSAILGNAMPKPKPLKRRSKP